MRYVAFIHSDAEPGHGISFPDFPGCVSDGDTIDEAVHRGTEALAFHVEGMIQDGEEIPEPRSIQEVEADRSLTEWRDGAVVCLVPLILDKGSPRRVNVSLDYGLLEAIDDAARQRGMTRSAFLSSAARKEIEGRDQIAGNDARIHATAR